MLIAILAAAALQAAPSVQSTSVAWMAGYWLDCSNGREVSETWSDPRAGLSVGHAVTVSSTGRVSFEMAHIGLTDNGFAYVAQPGGAPPTAFYQVDGGDDFAVFSNPENDFPTHVTYRRTGDVLTARIEGDIDGQHRAMDWTFQRAELNARCPAV